jgi:hypothetical protein
MQLAVVALLGVLLAGCDDVRAVARKAKRAALGTSIDIPEQPPTRAPKEPGNTAALGINLAAIEDWSTAVVFVDAMKMSRSWISGSANTWDDARPLDLDGNGWVRSLLPGQIARTLMFTDVKTAAKGRITVRYEGVGTLQYSHAVVSRGPGEDVIDFDPALGHLILNITSVDGGKPLRNIRVISPPHCVNDTCVDFAAMKELPLFHPLFLDDHRGFGTLRFMDWARTNNQTQAHFADRAKPTDARFSTEKGVPLEVMIAAAAALSTNVWVNVPHRADDDFVVQMATLLRDQVALDRRIYVEFSNETWNGQFTQGRSFGGNSENVARASSARTVAVMKLFERTFGDVKRLVRIMGSQSANSFWSEVVLSHQHAWEHVDALAIAPYVGGEVTAAKDASAVIATLTANITAMTAEVAAQKAIADRYGVQLIAYEGGQHLVVYGPAADDKSLNAALDDANRLPAMGNVYGSYLRAWRDAGGGLMVPFNDCGTMSKFGRWGAREFAGQPRAQAPKLDAMLMLLEDKAR